MKTVTFLTRLKLSESANFNVVSFAAVFSVVTFLVTTLKTAAKETNDMSAMHEY